MGYGVAGVDPTIMGIGPVNAIKNALKHANMTLEQMNLIEINEAFSTQYIACEREFGLNRDITNVNSGGVAIGHPLAASGTRITMHLLYELVSDVVNNMVLAQPVLVVVKGIAVVVEALQETIAMKDDEIIYDWNVNGNAVSLPMRKVELFDETLRDGIQCLSATDPTIDEKLNILRLLDKMGIDSADIGLPGAGPRAVEDVTIMIETIRDEGLNIKPVVLREPTSMISNPF